MDSHSERQILLLRRMGVDIWKLRQPAIVAAPDSCGSTVIENPEGSSPDTTPEPGSAGGLHVPAEEERPVKQPSTVATGVGETVETFHVASNEPPASGTQGSPVTHSPDNVQLVDQVKEKPLTPAAVAAGKEPDSDVATGAMTESAGAVVNWCASISHASAGQWCFVCACSSYDAAVEKKLLDAILFALDLDASDHSLIWAVPVRENEAEPDTKSTVAETLASLLEQEKPGNIVVMGEQLAQFLIGTDKPLEILRTENYRYQGGKSRLFITSGLAGLLAHPEEKATVWRDLVKAKSAIS